MLFLADPHAAARRRTLRELILHPRRAITTKARKLVDGLLGGLLLLPAADVACLYRATAVARLLAAPAPAPAALLEHQHHTILNKSISGQWKKRLRQRLGV
jgi:hypothetical protein